VGREFDFAQDLEKKLNETIDRELEQLEDIFVGTYMEDEDENLPEPKRKPGRPRGVLESTHRKAKSNVIGQILERTLRALENLEVLSEIIKKVGSGYVLYSKKKDKKGHRKKLGSFSSKGAAEKREKQIQYFKNKQ
jgi:hypothetical protein